jgi:hypothetical protein
VEKIRKANEMAESAFPGFGIYAVRFLLAMALGFPVGLGLGYLLRLFLGRGSFVGKFVLVILFFLLPSFLAGRIPIADPVSYYFLAYGAAAGLSLGLFGEALF